VPGTRIGPCGNRQSDPCKSPSRPTTLAQQQGELVKRSREPRPKPATELPLDDDSCNGTEQWREIDGIRFCHWDRWLLRLALTEPEGLRSIAREFRQRVRSHEAHPAKLVTVCRTISLTSERGSLPSRSFRALPSRPTAAISSGPVSVSFIRQHREAKACRTIPAPKREDQLRERGWR
jgi:hypothetical protein